MASTHEDDGEEHEDSTDEYTVVFDRASTQIWEDRDGDRDSREAETSLQEMDYLVVGYNPSPTLMEAAREYDIPVLDEGDFRDLLRAIEVGE